MITIRNIKEKPAKLFNPEDEEIGVITTVLDFYDVRCQIKEKQLKGYYFMFGSYKVNILVNGKLTEHPSELFGKTDNYLEYLLGWIDNY